jgi:hypothetical protein
MSTVRIHLPRLHAGQRLVAESLARYNVICAGRRFGKNILAYDLAVQAVLRGLPVAWYEPTYKSLRISWEAVRSILQPVIRQVLEQERRIVTLNGGLIEYWTLEDQDAGRGRHYGRVIINEAGHAPRLREAWTGAIRPTLTDLQGDAVFLGTPNGRNMFWELFARAQTDTTGEWRAWQMPTSANPHISPSEIAAARESLPERAFRQEYLAEFVEDGGGVFRGIAEAVDSGRSQSEPPDAHRRYVMGVDLARMEDYTVITVLDETGRQVYWDRLQLASWAVQVTQIVDVAERYRADIWLDATGLGDPVLETVQDAVLDRQLPIAVQGYRFAGPEAKRRIIDNLSISITRGTLRLMDIDVQTAELQAYSYEVTAAGNVRMSAPPGLHDDCVIALALAAWGLEQSRPRVPLRIGAITEDDDIDHEGWVEI